MTDKKKETVRTVKFLFFSVSAGLIEILTFSLFNEAFHLSYWVCYLTALVLSVLWNFTLNRRYTFQSANNVPLAMFQVFCYYLVFAPVTTFLGNKLTGNGWNEYVVTGINMVLNFVTEYLYDRVYVFRDSLDTNDIARKKQK